MSEGAFYRAFPVNRGEGSNTGRLMLERALQERDRKGVEYGLYLGFRFGISEAYLDVLLQLAMESWHECHEDVIDALAKLKSPRSVDVLVRTALTTFPYRDYDECNSLGTKCIWALGNISTMAAVLGLGKLLVSGDSNLEREAQAQLRRVESEGLSEDAREAARETLAAWRDESSE